MKTYRFLNGTHVEVSDTTCRGCLLENFEGLAEELWPVWGNNTFVVRQDAECPIPGFYIISTRQHIHTIADLSDTESSHFGLILSRIRRKMYSVLGIQRVHIILEERMVEPHFHMWLLPLFSSVMQKYHIDPKIWNSNIKEYLDLFTYVDNRETILRYNKLMRDALECDEVLLQIKEG